MAEALRPGDPCSAGPYQLIGRLGRGGMGQVFLGRSQGGFQVAVKVIRPELLADNPDFRTRFAREVAAARKVNALFTAPVVAADPDAHMPWLATAYVPGPSLADAVREFGPLPGRAVSQLAAGLAEGLVDIHEARVIHRDLKPSNVLLAGDGPRIIDFGISRAIEASALTNEGGFIGSPAFMSPEQFTGEEIGPPSDVFSLGSLLTFAATGRAPFSGDTLPALFFQVLNSPATLTGVPSSLLPVLERCLAKNPADRPTPSEIVAELGPTGLLHDWLPAAVAETLPRYDPWRLVSQLNLGMTESGGLARSGGPPATTTVMPPPGPLVPAPRPSEAADDPAGSSVDNPAGNPASSPAGSPGTLHPTRPPTQPTAWPTQFAPPRPMQVSPYPATPVLPVPLLPAPRIGVLMPAYRFGWLGLPLLAFVGAAAFTLPAETVYAIVLGFVPAIVISRIALARGWPDSQGGSGLVDRVIGWITRDVGGAIGLLALAACMVAVTAYVVLPIVAFAGPGQHPSLIRLGRAILTEHPVGILGSSQATGYFIHLIVTIPVLVVAARLLLRTRAAWNRPLLLPWLAWTINKRHVSVKAGVAGALLVLTFALIGLNGGLTPSKLPIGPICAVGRWTCAHHASVVRSTARQVYLLTNR